MEYRKLGKTNEEVSILGFGCMRFEVEDNDESRIKEDKAIGLLRHAIDNGVNYIDTAYPYHKGMSEPLVAKALKGGYREKVHLATKLPSWLIKSREDFDRYLNEQLERLETDVIDFYLIHAFNKERWTNLRKNGLFDFLDAAKADGRIKHAGFSFHDEYAVFEEIIDGYDWEFCQIQMNFLDEEHQAGLKGLKFAYEQGMGVIIMEPLRGGSLADPSRISEDIKELWQQSGKEYTPAEWALRYLFDMEEVGLVLSGMNQMEQLTENLKVAAVASPSHLSEQEKMQIWTVRDAYMAKIKVHCTSCNYCMPCPQGVDIPSCFSMYNDAHMLSKEPARKSYFNFLDEGERADRCVACGECMSKCPQHIQIIDELKNVVKYFA